MGLKRYTDYINETKNMKSSSPEEETPKVQEPKVQEPKVQEPVSTPKIKKIQKPQKEKPSVSESIVFDGKIVLFNGAIKPSTTISLLESKNVSKDKLHFIITEQKDSFVVLKYNTDTKIKLNMFFETLIDYHKRDENIKALFENIEVSGTDTYVIVKNISDKIKSLMIESTKTLLKK